MTIGKLVNKYHAGIHVFVRVLVGLMFFMHGFGKLANGFSVSLMGIAGIVEVLVGLGLLLGFFTRLAALGGAITMIVAYGKVHLAQGFNPLANGGELALLYLFLFLGFMAHGAGSWSLEKKLLKKEKF
jgi:putative oxidoreductase